jgi:hypothetical protein
MRTPTEVSDEPADTCFILTSPPHRSYDPSVDYYRRYYQKRHSYRRKNEQPDWQPNRRNNPKNIAGCSKQVWPATPKEFSARQFILVRRTLIKLQLFQQLNRGQLIVFPLLFIFEVSPQSDYVFGKVKLF